MMLSALQSGPVQLRLFDDDEREREKTTIFHAIGATCHLNYGTLKCEKRVEHEAGGAVAGG